MTATQTLKIYQVLSKHFKDETDANAVVEQIEMIIEEKIEAKKDVLATKQDLNELRLATKEDISSVKDRLDSHFKWLIGIMAVFFSIAIAIIKSLH